MTTLEFTSRIPADQRSLFNFHTNFTNVGLVTPSFITMRFITIPDLMREGSNMTVELRQFGRWIPWDVTVECLIPHSLMVDVQSGRGPFKTWRHEHHFIEKSDGVYLLDRLHYELPFGAAGKLFDLFIFRTINRLLFSYRHKKTKEYFLRS